MYYCYIHNWSSKEKMCPACNTVSTADSHTIPIFTPNSKTYFHPEDYIKQISELKDENWALKEQLKDVEKLLREAYKAISSASGGGE